MHPDRLLLETLSDLRARARNQTNEYEALLIAGLLRKLLLDGHSLVDEVNRTRRLKIRYVINDCQPPDLPGLVAWNALDGLDVDGASDPHPKTVPLDGLLQQTIVISDGHRYTVKDLITHQANAAGAVHIGPPRTEKSAALRQNELSLESAEWPMQILNLPAIARVVLRGLEELRSVVASELGEKASP